MGVNRLKSTKNVENIENMFSPKNVENRRKILEISNALKMETTNYIRKQKMPNVRHVFSRVQAK